MTHVLAHSISGSKMPRRKAVDSTDVRQSEPIKAVNSKWNQRKNLLRRIHGWAALIASPFALIAVLTGMFYIATPQIEAVLYGHLDRVSSQGKPPLALDTLVTQARQAVPIDWKLYSVVVPHTPERTVLINWTPNVLSTSTDHNALHDASSTAKRPSFGLPEQTHITYVDPYSGSVVGRMANQDRFSTWAKRLHSRLLQSAFWRWMIELAASCLLVMLLTGMYLWWPRKNTATATLPVWKRWHSWTGVSLALLSAIILTTGLTWSQYAGQQIRWLRNAAHQAPPQAPAHLHSMPQPGEEPLSWQVIWERAHVQNPGVALQLRPSHGPYGTWRISSAESGQPFKRFDRVLDAYSGQTLYYADWSHQTAFGKATAVGIPFHRGELGWWNQVLLLLFGLGLLFSLISGWIMLYKRPNRLLPPLLPGTWSAVSPFMLGIAVALCVLMPLLAAATLVVILLEWGMAIRQKWGAT